MAARPPRIIYVVDDKNWVQRRRLNHLRGHQKRHRFFLLSWNWFVRLWPSGLLKRRPIFFTNWRMIHGLLKTDPRFFQSEDRPYLMTAVTSHSNLGGGLDPAAVLGERTPDEALDIAQGVLEKFKVVTANSRLLADLLGRRLPGLRYTPNGVDAEFFNPADRPDRAGGRLRIGWIGKVRAAKNLELVDRVVERLQSDNGFEFDIRAVPKGVKAPWTPAQVRDFYRSLDFYLCASTNEGTPNPALEAAACGTALITTWVGNMPQLVQPGVNGYFVEPTVGSLTERLIEVAKLPPERREAMGRAARETVERDWSWPRRIGPFVDAFDELTTD